MEAAGRVWAIDVAGPPLLLEAEFTNLLGGPRPGQQPATPLVANGGRGRGNRPGLQMLFTIYGTPMVLKMDNGSHFVAAATQALLAVWGAVPLFSPPGYRRTMALLKRAWAP